MLFRKKGTELIYDVKPHLLPLYEGNEAYEIVEPVADTDEEAEKPKRTTKKK